MSYEVYVEVPFKTSVAYKVRVKNPKNIDQIYNALRKLDPSHWNSDPDFYEQLGSDYNSLIEKVTLADVYLVEKVKRKPH